MTAPMCSVKVASAGVTGECPRSVISGRRGSQLQVVDELLPRVKFEHVGAHGRRPTIKDPSGIVDLCAVIVVTLPTTVANALRSPQTLGRSTQIRHAREQAVAATRSRTALPARPMLSGTFGPQSYAH